MYERACTFEGPPNFSTFQKLRGEYVTKQMVQQANSIAYHIQNLTFGLKNVDRMVLNFKIDKQGRMWFLWCSSLRLKGDDINAKPKFKNELMQEVFPEEILNSDNPGIKHLIRQTNIENEKQKDKGEENS